MALVICPECKAEISSSAENCIHCGFPIKHFLNDNGLNDFDHLKICPKCAYTNCSSMPDILPIYLKCQNCGTQVVQTDIPLNGIPWFKGNREDEKEYMGNLANKYGGNQFSPEAYDEWIAKLHSGSNTSSASKQQNTPKCPTCGSTNLKKITATQKASNAVLFGLFGNKRKKQFHCNNCGYEW